MSKDAKQIRLEQDATSEFSSPPCFMHEVDNHSADVPDRSQQQIDLKRWRKAERERLIALRFSIPAETRQRFTEALAAHLDSVVGDLSGKTISLFWPFKGEADLRPWMESATKRGAICALPVVERPATPLTFRSLRQGEKLDRGVWNIPIPSRGREVTPDIVLAPLVGFDSSGYRLGYGGGYFDRTLAALATRSTAVGVGFSVQQISTIYPQSYDVPMNVIVTEQSILERKSSL